MVEGGMITEQQQPQQPQADAGLFDAPSNDGPNAAAAAAVDSPTVGTVDSPFSGLAVADANVVAATEPTDDGALFPPPPPSPQSPPPLPPGSRPHPIPVRRDFPGVGGLAGRDRMAQRQQLQQQQLRKGSIPGMPTPSSPPPLPPLSDRSRRAPQQDPRLTAAGGVAALAKQRMAPPLQRAPAPPLPFGGERQGQDLGPRRSDPRRDRRHLGSNDGRAANLAMPTRDAIDSRMPQAANALRRPAAPWGAAPAVEGEPQHDL